MKFLSSTLAIIFALSTAAFAQMADVDADGDGMASYDELITVYANVTEDQFAEMDSNQDGNLDQEEMTAAMDAGTLVMPE